MADMKKTVYCSSKSGEFVAERYSDNRLPQAGGSSGFSGTTPPLHGERRLAPMMAANPARIRAA